MIAVMVATLQYLISITLGYAYNFIEKCLAQTRFFSVPLFNAC